MAFLRFLVLILVVYCYQVNCAKILGLFVAPSKSHYTLANVLFNELARKGHDVTIIAPYEEKNPPKNSKYRNILWDQTKMKAEEGKNINMFESSMTNPVLTVFFLNWAGTMITNGTLNNPDIQKLLKSNEKFDAVIMDQFITDGLTYFANHFSAHHILLSTVPTNSWVNQLVGNPSPPSYVPEMMMGYPPEMTFFQRTKNLFFYSLMILNNHLYHYPKQNALVKEHFPNSNIYDYLYNVSLVLANGHESYSDAVPLVPVIKNIGGYHVLPPKKLPDDIQKFMDSSKNGVIYFSMGSNLQSKDLPNEIKEGILKVLSKLNLNVLWKFEDDSIKTPKNIKIQKWFPQSDILAHPNLKLFITHGGGLSTTEAIYHGVPLLAIPVYGDQRMNAESARNKGYAIDIPYIEFEIKKFEEALHEMISNPKYKENAVLRSKIFHDRPMKPLDEAVYWVEYVIRHGGAKHLRVAALNLTWYQYLLLDVILFLLTSVVVVYYLLKMLLKKLFAKKKPTEKNVKTTKGNVKPKKKTN